MQTRRDILKLLGLGAGAAAIPISLSAGEGAAPKEGAVPSLPPLPEPVAHKTGERVPLRIVSIHSNLSQNLRRVQSWDGHTVDISRGLMNATLSLKVYGPLPIEIYNADKVRFGVGEAVVTGVIGSFGHSCAGYGELYDEIEMLLVAPYEPVNFHSMVKELTERGGAWIQAI